MEMHLVHLRTDFDDFNDTAKLTENSLAVVGILFHIGDEAAPEIEVMTSTQMFLFS